MKLHPRVQVEVEARRAIDAGFETLFPVGSGIEDACIAVAEVERICLAHSAGEVLPDLPVDWTPTGKLWTLVRETVEAHELTWGEASRLVHHLSDYWLNVIVRVERHGNREGAKADEA